MTHRIILFLTALALGGCPEKGATPDDAADVLGPMSDAQVEDIDGATRAPDADAAPDRDAALRPDLGQPTRPARAPLMTEFMARNTTAAQDEDGDTPDWIELLNPHAEPISLAGFALSDGEDDDESWPLPAVTLDPGAHLVVWASGKDRADPEGALHTDFKISGDGEVIRLTTVDGAEVQRFPATPLGSDQAFGLHGVVLVPEDAEALVAPAPLPADWMAANFDDADWQTGTLGIGFEPGTGGGPALRADALLGVWDFETVTDRVVVNGVESGRFDGALSEGAVVTRDGSGRDGSQALRGEGDGWMAVSTPQAFDFARDFTWSVWFKGVDDSGALISRNPAGTGWNRGSKALFVRDGRVQWDSGWVGNPSTRTSVTDDRWYHAVVTYIADDDALRLYINGQLEFDDAFDVNAFPEDLDDQGGRAQSGLFVGQAYFSGGLRGLDNYEGLIDDVAIWNAALTEDEVAALYAGAELGGGGPLSALIRTPLPDSLGGAARVDFEVGGAYDALVLRTRFDDAFAAWLDGGLVAADNIAAPYDQADVPRDDERARTWTPTPVSPGAVVEGRNTLAIQGSAADEETPNWVVSPSLVGLSTAQVGVLERPTPGTLNAPGISPAVRFSRAGGQFSAPFELTLSTPEPDVPIHYTTDGAQPGPESPRYAAPIPVDAPVLIKARAFADGRAPGPLTTARFVSLGPDLADTTSSLPLMVIDRLGQGEARHGIYSDGLVMVFEAGEDGLARLSAAPTHVSDLAMKVRGQSSAGAPKRPYRIELRDAEGKDRDLPLLGMPADADWILHGPFTDKSLIRNALVYQLARDLGLAAPRARLCELYVNRDADAIGPEDYRGVYLLVERNELSGERLNLPPSPADAAGPPEITGSYLLKFEADVAEPPVVPGWGRLEVVVPKDPTDAQLTWLAQHFDRFQQLLDAGRGEGAEPAYAALMDRRSFIDQMVINELTRDQDAYVRSAYLHIPQSGPITMGPLWDYNLTMGTGGYFDNTNTEGWQFRHPYNSANPRWFVQLMDDPAFADDFRARWQTLRRDILSDAAMAARIQTFVDLIGEAGDRNFTIWNNLREGRVNGFESPRAPTWTGQIEALRTWIVRRSAWIDAQLR